MCGGGVVPPWRRRGARIFICFVSPSLEKYGFFTALATFYVRHRCYGGRNGGRIDICLGASRKASVNPRTYHSRPWMLLVVMMTRSGKSRRPSRRPE